MPHNNLQRIYQNLGNDDTPWMQISSNRGEITLNIDEVKQLAQELMANMNVRACDYNLFKEGLLKNVKDSYETTNSANYQEEFQIYIAIIKAIIQRNTALKDLEKLTKEAKRNFINALKDSFDLWVVSPIAIGLKLGGRLFGRTLGAKRIYDGLNAIVPPMATLKLPSVGVKFRSTSYNFPSSRESAPYNSFRFKFFEIKIHPLTIIMGPMLYFWSSIGKLTGAIIGTVIGVVLSPVAAIHTAITTYSDNANSRHYIAAAKERIRVANEEIIHTLNKSKSPEKIIDYYNYLKHEQKEDLANMFRNGIESSAQDVSDLHFYLGGIYRDEGNIEKALDAYNKVQPTDKNFTHAMYEAAQIALQKYRDVKEESAQLVARDNMKSYCELGRKTAVSANYKDLVSHFDILLRMLELKPDEHVVSEVMPTEESPLLENQQSVSWRQPPATNYHDARNKALDRQNVKSETEVTSNFVNKI